MSTRFRFGLRFLLGVVLAVSVLCALVADAGRIYQSSDYQDKVVKLLDYLLNADNIRGAGRLYLP